MNDSLVELLKPSRLTEVLDVGANPIDGIPPYKSMLEAGLCRVTGCEPNLEAYTTLMGVKGPNETYLPYAIGDGAYHELKMCYAPGMTSLLEPDSRMLEVFQLYRELAEVVARNPLPTKRLDDMEEVDSIDFLKIDVQGSELSVFQNGVKKLSKTTVIQTEVSFTPFYENQPLFADVDHELRRQGFIFHTFITLKPAIIAPSIIAGDLRNTINQLVEADAVYVRDYTRMEHIPDEELKHLALVAHYCYGSMDIALRGITALRDRGSLPPDADTAYASLLNKNPPRSPRRWLLVPTE